MGENAQSKKNLKIKEKGRWTWVKRMLKDKKLIKRKSLSLKESSK